MTDENTTTKEEVTKDVAADIPAPVSTTDESVVPTTPRPRNPRRSTARPQRGERVDRTPEFAQKIIGIRRVVRVMGGGRRFSFSVAMVIGDKKGRVGVGLGKAGDTALAIEKAIRNAKKNMITIKRTESNSLPHNTEAKYGSTVIEIRPAQGRGLVAGASVRTVLELGGVTDVTTKVLSRSKNKTNIARAAIVALLKLEN